MSWVRFIPGFSRHPKRLKCGPISSWLWICSVDHCMTYLTDGFLDEAAVPGLCPVIVGSALKRAVANLVACGSWERLEGGYHVHGYLDHNLSRAQIEADRAAGRERYQTWKSRQVRTRDLPPTPHPNAVATPLQTPEQQRNNTVATPDPNAVATFLSDGRSVGRSKDETTSKGDGSRHEPEQNPTDPVVTPEEVAGLPVIAQARGITVAQAKSELVATKLRALEREERRRQES